VTLLTVKNAFIVGAVLIGSFLAPGRWHKGLLLGGSLLLLVRLTGPYAVVFIGAVVVTWLLPRAWSRWPRALTPLFLLGIAANLAVLAVFKYRPSAMHGLARRLFGDGAAESLGPVLVPLGLSYFALQAVSYLVDVRRGRAPAGSGLADVALYLTYFPKFLAGPIERAGDFLERLAAPRAVDNERAARSLTLLVLGLFRKFVLANPLLAISGIETYASADAPGGAASAALLAAHVFAVYNDFAGYTNLAQGISGLFGLDLSPNFRRPFFAQGLGDFWSRWHASLTGWLKEYIYFPLTRAMLKAGRGWAGPAALALPPVLTLLFSGLWHGASPQFLAWGGLVGALLAVEAVFGRSEWGRRWRAAGGAAAAARAVLVTTVMSLTTVLFVLPIPAAAAFWRSLFDGSAPAAIHPALLPLLGISLLLDAFQARGRDDASLVRWPLPLRAAGLALAVLVIFLATRSTGPRVFIYQGF